MSSTTFDNCPRRRQYTYELVEGPMPVSDYLATLAVEDAQGGSVVRWSSEFTPVGDPEAEVQATTAEFLQAGLDNLKTLYG